MDPEAATRLISKLRAFVIEALDDDERTLLAMLLAPGVDRAYADADEVTGYGLEQRSAVPFPEALVDALRSSGVRVVGLDDHSS